MSVTQKAVDANGNTITSTTAGATVRYIVEYSASGSATAADLSNITLQEAMSSDMVLQGNCNIPPVWSATPNGTTASNFVVSSLSNQISTDLNANATPVGSTASGRGDGYMPVIYHSTDGSLNKYFEIYHHQGVGGEILSNLVYGVPEP